MGRLPPTARHRHSDKVHLATERQGSLASPSFRGMRWTERLPFRFGVFVQSGPTGSGHRRRNTIFHRTLPDCDPGDRSVAGAIFCIADIVEGGASFRAAFLPFPFARRCRLRQRRAKTKTPRRSAGPARQKYRSERQWRATRSRPPNGQAARGRSSPPCPSASMLAASSAPTRASAATLPTPPRAV